MPRIINGTYGLRTESLRRICSSINTFSTSACKVLSSPRTSSENILSSRLAALRFIIDAIRSKDLVRTCACLRGRSPIPRIISDAVSKTVEGFFWLLPRRFAGYYATAGSGGLPARQALGLSHAGTRAGNSGTPGVTATAGCGCTQNSARYVKPHARQPAPSGGRLN
jgi:hypothetical protein